MSGSEEEVHGTAPRDHCESAAGPRLERRAVKSLITRFIAEEVDDLIASDLSINVAEQAMKIQICQISFQLTFSPVVYTVVQCTTAQCTLGTLRHVPTITITIQADRPILSYSFCASHWLQFPLGLG